MSHQRSYVHVITLKQEIELLRLSLLQYTYHLACPYNSLELVINLIPNFVKEECSVECIYNTEAYVNTV